MDLFDKFNAVFSDTDAPCPYQWYTPKPKDEYLIEHEVVEWEFRTNRKRPFTIKADNGKFSMPAIYQLSILMGRTPSKMLEELNDLAAELDAEFVVPQL